jgi:hypothetical protein
MSEPKVFPQWNSQMPDIMRDQHYTTMIIVQGKIKTQHQCIKGKPKRWGSFGCLL